MDASTSCTLLSHGIRSCERAVTLSKHAKSEIGHFLGSHYLPKISIAPGAVRPEFGQVVGDTLKQQVRATYHLPNSFFLTVATVEPRKNLPTLFAAYTQLRQQLGQECPALGGRWSQGMELRRYPALHDDSPGECVFPGPHFRPGPHRCLPDGNLLHLPLVVRRFWPTRRRSNDSGMPGDYHHQFLAARGRWRRGHACRPA